MLLSLLSALLSLPAAGPNRVVKLPLVLQLACSELAQVPLTAMNYVFETEPLDSKGRAEAFSPICQYYFSYCNSPLGKGYPVTSVLYSPKVRTKKVRKEYLRVRKYLWKGGSSYSFCYLKPLLVVYPKPHYWTSPAKLLQWKIWPPGFFVSSERSSTTHHTSLSHRAICSHVLGWQSSHWLGWVTCTIVRSWITKQ